MRFSPTAHFMSFSMGILYRGAGFDTVWPPFAAVAGIGLVFFTGALLRFRRTISLASA
jgi:ABC-2 type transport system permease protein